MRASLQSLIELQKVDIQLMEIEELKGDLPAEVEYLDSELLALSAEISELGTRIEDLNKEKRHLEAEIVDSTTSLKKYQDQLLLVTSNRAYDALMTEIDTVKEAIESAEMRTLEIDDSVEKSTEQLQNDEAASEAKTNQLSASRASLTQTIAETEAQAAKLQSERSAIIPQIDSIFYDSYERLREARDGVAVVELSRGSCGSCYFELPQQIQVDVRAMDRIITCNSCGVILYPEETANV